MGSPSIDSSSWVVVWTESRAEKQVESRLVARGIEAWLPKFVERRRWSDRWREVVLPLFPGYLFARGGAGEAATVLRTPGVMTLVKKGSLPALLSDDFVRSLRSAVESSGVPASPVEAAVEFHVGDEVVVSEGPLAGTRGYIRDVRNGRSLIVWIQAIGRGVAFTIGSASVKPADA
jgi:transcriptional antiterminator RfaH